MPRPKSWFETNDYNAAKRASKDRGHGLWKFTRKDRDGKNILGYFVGARLPVRLRNATVEKKA
jgi:hypothetical protein